MRLSQPFNTPLSSTVDYTVIDSASPCGCMEGTGDGVIAIPGTTNGNTSGSSGGGTNTILYGRIRAVRKSFKVGESDSLMTVGQTVLALNYRNVVEESADIFIDGPYVPEVDSESIAASIVYFDTGITIIFNQGVITGQHITISFFIQEFGSSAPGGSTSHDPIYFTVGAAGAPADGSTVYDNPDLSNDRIGLLFLSTLSTPLAPSEWERRTTGGFDLLGGRTFHTGEKWVVVFSNTTGSDSTTTTIIEASELILRVPITGEKVALSARLDDNPLDNGVTKVPGIDYTLLPTDIPMT